VDFEEAFWRFVDQKWKDSLNVTPAEPVGTDGGQEARSWSLKMPKKKTASHIQHKSPETKPMEVRC
jgi:hypothetical protein